MNNNRVFTVKYASAAPGPVIYWMSRDQRVNDNWALLHASGAAEATGSPFAVVFCVDPGFPGATMRHYSFMLDGLRQVEDELRKKGIHLFILAGGEPGKEVADFANRNRAAAVVCDFDPLRIKREWRKMLSENYSGKIIEVDAHNIVPCRTASQKLEYGAYTLRPKIKRALDEFMDEYPAVAKRQNKWPGAAPRNDWNAIRKKLHADDSAPVADGIEPGEKAARRALNDFILKRLPKYNKRNDPNAEAVSGLSPYLHFGQLSAQRVAIEVRVSSAPDAEKEAFLEELIVRRELSDNYCFFNENYDNIEGIPRWAKETLDAHRRDVREYVYEYEQFDAARTHDELWNAAQIQMRATGTMHGYMRMYWAKKILEWSRSPEEAFSIAARLNDRYELDGRDPNGYAGIAWSIGGLHDRAWKERPVYGKIRYMSRRGCEAKFDVPGYIRSMKELKI